MALLQTRANTALPVMSDERTSLGLPDQQVRKLKSDTHPYNAHLTLSRSGCAVITDKNAFLFTDGRYFLQAEKELDQFVYIRTR